MCVTVVYIKNGGDEPPKTQLEARANNNYNPRWTTLTYVVEQRKSGLYILTDGIYLWTGHV